ncbi:PSD1 and planctomycete cytochrome C domain-containing protein [Tuwongella immobilis]|uniref:Cytochrome c domain-containing protein n=1 Tax=Tuwongella immobilis TaxID=692036 RepID=A0A6C2YK13_9BACT|nr:DUF1549 domain-containing protein [Tuwongella immobilis]VIP01714.1 signal peptide protein : Uncharacterized protein OS=Singulisphaera acidiphila (strain ATCC BAA-1392 / DSM 18658 / VKM B-2454 / MOB10) GN=Sinac_6140 PE=4 SV=1: PSCyt1: PSCyt2: PSD1 [Tuwongella immobilis]VTR99230.1 signal peptide protein : Uncharacterized protein OS=Singulisphaera acidiphila (strain ATCC BAA-1392 / DSM 18658 / VKM B-2454 / MOB10) GN=Sinac_6140 PE=4 SV=1: PSCyt1: PSCyt2: PSD1 [Tuwongella immobilis]
MRKQLIASASWTGLLACCLFPATVRGTDFRIDADYFEAKIRPILLDSCGRCHGPTTQQHGLRLDSRQSLLTGGDSGPAIVPGKPQESLLLKAVQRTGTLKMPPGKPLSAAQIADLTKWIEAGAPWPDSAIATKPTAAAPHWAFQPVKSPPVPQPKMADRVRNPIDSFVLTKLEQANLSPSPLADRRTLIRRVTLDLTGLPPTMAEVEAFVADPDPQAYAKLVDRLLASPHYGEQWARHWLDVARYSDSKGYVYGREERMWIHAWAYRDWVVQAFNRDLPYDQFLKLQIAADQLAKDNPSDLAAMGFLTLNRRFLGVTHDIVDDRIDTLTRGMLGLTVSCARCHDHKFDPIPTEDYYSLYGIFRSSSERDVVAGEPLMPGDRKAFETALADQRKKLEDERAKARREAAERNRKRVGEYLAAQLELHKYPEEGFDQILAASDIIPATVRQWREYLTRAGQSQHPVFAAWHAFAKLPADGFAAQAMAVTTQLQSLPADRLHPIVKARFASSPASMRDVVDRYTALFQEAERLSAQDADAKPEWAAIRRVLFDPLSPCEVPDEPIVDAEQFFPSDVVTRLWQLQGNVDRFVMQSPMAPKFATILVDRPTPMTARIFRRGNPAMPTTEAPRRFLKAISPENRANFQSGSGRRELAEAIANPQNPLTARVMVNRLWMHHFGAGLVRTPSDFGTRAEPPTHPELLDWLADSFVRNRWSLKEMHRLMVLSATYQQASSGPADAAAFQKAELADPENKLLWRTNPRRLRFEELRDAMFAVTGELDRTVGGRAVNLFSSPFSKRRSVYGVIDREFFPELLRVFDMANPDLHIPQRSETIVPQQALFFLNHPLPIERAKAIVQHPLIQSAKTPEAKVDAMMRLLVQRPATAAEVAAAVEWVRQREASSEQAKKQYKPNSWKYGVGAYDPKSGAVSNFRELPYFTGEAWQGGPDWPNAGFGWAQLTASGGHPGNTLNDAVVRRWTSPIAGKVTIRSLLVHDVAQGDGVRATIHHHRLGKLLSADVYNRRQHLNVTEIVVQPGDTIDFTVDILNQLNSDQYTWTATIAPVPDSATTPPTKPLPSFDSKAEFGGPETPQLTAWEQLAQTLLMANEFTFLD